MSAPGQVDERPAASRSGQAGAVPPTLAFLWRLITYSPWRYLLAAAGWAVFHLWPLLPGVLGKLLFDVLEGRAAPGLTVWTVVAIVVAGGLARCTAIVGATAAWAGWYLRARGLVQRNLLDRVFRLPGAQAMPKTVGESLSTVRDDSDAIALMGGWGFDMLSGITFAVGGLAILLSVDVRTTVIVMVPLAVVLALAQLARARAYRVREQSREATARVTGTIGEIVTAVRAIKAADKREEVVDRLRADNRVRKGAMIRDRVQSLAIDSVFNSTASLGAGLVLLVAGARMRSGEFTTGDFVLFATYLMQVAEYTYFMGYLVRTYQQSGVSFVRAAELLQGARPMTLVDHHPLHLKAEPPPPAPVPRAEPLRELEVRSLTHVFPGTTRGVRDVSLTIKPGTVTVVTGEVGSGKTTLLRAVLGLYAPQGGEIRWNGERVEDPGDFMVPPRVAYTPQTPVLLSGSVRENVLLGLPDDGRVERAVHTAVLAPDLARLDAGLDTEIGVRGVRLSGGQVQRTAAARMFAREPALLVMDDLSSALDVETEQELWRRIFATSTTCLAVSHRPAVLERADQVLLLKDGRVIAAGPLARLLETSADMRLHYRTPPTEE
ncbi:ABC transporter ATP-binding protein [Saccharothrix syringae]|uniref:ABC transporter ATP-binding protein n=1 Tax=Saccharothrix syringae TaxID=103733 RepID=A0A5Q0H619_SACSY|nr:ABC transporter ATP-binding protein [Saccharothrix syringae]QFZ21182.1 ABC transporter ATP-binding protein [Saccharothrix syringae]